MVYKYLFDLLFPKESYQKSEFEKETSKDWVDAIVKSLVEVNYKKGAILLSIGDIPSRIFFLQKGSIRGYFYSEQGTERTLYLWEGFSVVTDIISFIETQPSDVNIEVVKDVTLLSLSRMQLDEILGNFPQSDAFTKSLTLLYAKHHKERTKDFISLTADERMIKFNKLNKSILQMFPTGFIASYLGMSKSWLFGINKKKRR